MVSKLMFEVEGLVQVWVGIGLVSVGIGVVIIVFYWIVYDGVVILVVSLFFYLNVQVVFQVIGLVDRVKGKQGCIQFQYGVVVV